MGCLGVGLLGDCLYWCCVTSGGWRLGCCRRDAQGVEKRMCWKNYISILILKSPRIMKGPVFKSIYSDPGIKSSRNKGK